MKTYLVSVPTGDQALELAGALLDEGVLPEHLSVVLDESFAGRITGIQPQPTRERIETDLVAERANRDLRYATTGNPEMERSFKPPLADPQPIYESEVGAGISTASPNDDVSGIEEMDDASEFAEESLYPFGARDVRTHGPRSFSELDAESYAPTAPGRDVQSSATGIYGQDGGYGVGVFAALVPASVQGVGEVLGDGALATDLMDYEGDEADLGKVLRARGLASAAASAAELAFNGGAGLIEVAAASGEASARQIQAVLDRYGARRLGELDAL